MPDETQADQTQADPTQADTLTERLLGDPKKRDPLLNDCVRLIEDEVRRKSGISGVAIKGGFKVLQKIKPGILKELMDFLLDDFVRRVEPFWAEHRGAGGEPSDFKDFVASRPGPLADALLGITDERARRAKNKVLKQTYEKLRPQAKKHVEEAIPGVGRMLTRHL